MIYPAESLQTLQETGGGKWTELIEALAVSAGYAHVICDLSVCVQGLFDVMRCFDRIYMIERTDPVSSERIGRFMRALRRTGHEDLAAGIKRLALPVFTQLPADPACYGTGPLASYLKDALAEDIND